MALSDLATSSNEKREQRIMRLRNWFNNQEVVTVKAAENKTGFKPATIIKWCQDGNIPLIGEDGQPVVPLTPANKPKWL